MGESYVVEIRRPLGERASAIAEEEEMDLNDLVDFILRRYIEDYESGLEETESEDDQEEED